MAAFAILMIGTTLSLAAKRAWERRGVFLTLAQSPGEAVSLLRHGDFDLCLVAESISAENRAKLTDIVRQTLRLKVPVVSVVDPDDERAALSVPSHARALDQLISEAKAPPAAHGFIDSERSPAHKRLPVAYRKHS